MTTNVESGNSIKALFFVDKNGVIIDKVTGFVDGWEDKYLQSITAYFDGEDIDYQKFEFEKESKSKKDAILQIDF